MDARTPPRVAIPGAATARGTQRVATRASAAALGASGGGASLAAVPYRPLIGDLLAAALGAGTYLGEADDATDVRWRAALTHAFASGVNLVDTAINYRCQRAERVVGDVLRAGIDARTLRRDELIVCTKGGYVALDGTLPPTREAYREYVQREFLAPGLIERADLVAGGHCLAPRFLAHQIARSRANLGVERIDLYYLHNPEQQREARGVLHFRTQLRQAVELLEMKVAAGEIAAWGVASWQGLRVAPDHEGHLSLAEVMAVAREVAGHNHHFRVVQLPVNLAMPEAVRLPTQDLPDGSRVPALQAAMALGLAVVVSAPLLQGRLTSGLPPALAATFAGCETDAQRALAFVHSLPGVAAVLAGMSTPAHVLENLAAVGIARAEEQPVE